MQNIKPFPLMRLVKIKYLKNMVHSISFHSSVFKMRKWERTEIDALINIWETHPTLYDVRNRLYHNRTKREEIYNRIVEEIKAIIPGNLLFNCN